MRELERESEPETKTRSHALAIVGARTGRAVPCRRRRGRRNRGLAQRAGESSPPPASGAEMRAALRPRRGDRAPPARRPSPPRRGCAASATPAAPPGSTPLAAASERGIATFSLHPLQTIPDGGAELGGTPCAVAGSTADALALRGRPGRRARDAPVRGARGGPRRLPRRRLRWPPTSWSRSRSRRPSCSSGPGSRTRGSCSTPLVLRTAANWSERGGERPDRADRPRRRGDGRPPPRRPRRGRPRAARRLPGARATAPGRLRGGPQEAPA